MILDKKGKLFGKVSIIDLLVILVVILGVVGLWFTKKNLDNQVVLSDGSKMIVQSDEALDNLEIKLKVREVRDVTRDSIIVGDEVFLPKGEVLGKVVRVESEKATREVFGNNGTIFKAEVPDRFDVTIVVEAKGKKKPEGFYTQSNLHLLYGKELEIKTSTIQTTPKVEEIVVVPAQ